ncbi:MAG: ABC transporter permease [Lachnospiraceae bacterium]|nr:ABC transporter permease [Lachnospiraceae bacterium]
MKFKEILRLVFINLIQNKFKVILTSIGIVVGAATIVMVIAIGKGGKSDVAKQFKNLNAGAIDISYTDETESNSGNGSNSGMPGGGMMPGGGGPGGDSNSSGNNSNSSNSSKKSSSNSSSANSSSKKSSNSNSSSSSSSSKKSSTTTSAKSSNSSNTSGNNGGPGGNGGPPDMGNMGGNSNSGSKSGNSNRGMMGFGMNKNEKITLTTDDMDDITTFVSGLSDATISYTTKSTVEGGDLEEETSYTIAGVKENYKDMSNLSMSIGSFITTEDDDNKEKVCVLGYSLAKEIFGDVTDAYDSTIYIDGRAYIVNGVLKKMGSVSSGISPDTSIFIPYQTGVKYITGSDVNPTITVIASDVNQVSKLKKSIKKVLAKSYPNSSFTIADAGSKMNAALKSSKTLTTLLFAMAAIVFTVGGIGIMNVLFVSIKDRTEEIGILKAIGCTKKNILTEFLLEACFISIIGGLIGIGLSFFITPIVQNFNVTVEHSLNGAVLSLLFAVLTGTIFGIYPAYKASRLVPVRALNQD